MSAKLNPLLFSYTKLKARDFLSFTLKKAEKLQELTLKKLLFRAQNTEYGLKNQFSEILISNNVEEEYQKLVPLTDYSDMHSLWMRAYAGEENITWPKKTSHFALSSGTSEGASKHIPVTPAQIKCMIKAGRRQMWALVNTDLPKDYFTKDYLMLGGSTTLNFDGTSYSGDLSGITTQSVPTWFDKFSQPSTEIRALKGWDEKLEAIVKAAPTYDIIMIAGVPAWIKILFTEIIARYKLNTIHDIWPNFKVYLWGGVNLEPYRKDINALCGAPLRYYETYLASEAFIAFQTRPDSKGMRLVFRNYTYYEFIPFNENTFDSNGKPFPNVKAILLKDVEENVNYAIVISTCAGAWRYLIGDTIKFVDKENCEIKITGRTKHYISMCGEHLSGENMNDALQLCAQKLNCSFPEFTVKGIVTPSGKFGHTWYIACNSSIDLNNLKIMLDTALSSLNDDYAVERKHALTFLNIHLLTESVFLGWLKSKGKEGAQHKFPRVLSDTLFADWETFIKSK